MYYFVNDEDGRIVESTWGGDPELIAQQLANECQCKVYVIRGEHACIEVEPTRHNEDQRLRASGAPELPGLARLEIKRVEGE